jgi:hypothetical protein
LGFLGRFCLPGFPLSFSGYRGGFFTALGFPGKSREQFGKYPQGAFFRGLGMGNLS